MKNCSQESTVVCEGRDFVIAKSNRKVTHLLQMPSKSGEARADSTQRQWRGKHGPLSLLCSTEAGLLNCIAVVGSREFCNLAENLLCASPEITMKDKTKSSLIHAFMQFTKDDFYIFKLSENEEEEYSRHL